MYESIVTTQRLTWPGQAGDVLLPWGSGDGGFEGWEMTHFEHKRTLFNMDNTIFSLTIRGLMLQKGGGLKPKQEAEPPVPPSF